MAQHSTGTQQYVAAHGIGFQLDGMLALPLPHASKPSQMPAMRHRTLSSSAGSPGFTAGLSSLTSSLSELWSAFSVAPLFALQVTLLLETFGITHHSRGDEYLTQRLCSGPLLQSTVFLGAALLCVAHNAWCSNNQQVIYQQQKKRKEEFMLLDDHDRSLLMWQPGAVS